MSINSRIVYWLSTNAGSRTLIAQELGLTLVQVTNALTRLQSSGMKFPTLADERKGTLPRKPRPERAENWRQPSAETVIAEAIRSRSALEMAWGA
jgi:hypothetical protein